MKGYLIYPLFRRNLTDAEAVLFAGEAEREAENILGAAKETLDLLP